MKQTLKRIKEILLYLVILILSLYIILEAFFPNQTVKVFGFKPYVVVTQSMEPVIDVFDLVVDKKADVNNLKAGDIITFKVDIDYDGNLDVVTHYIYSINQDSNGTYIIRTHRYFANSADIYADPWAITGDEVLGQYMFDIPKAGYFVEFVKSPFGIGVIVFNALIIFAIVYVIKKGKENDEKIKKIEAEDELEFIEEPIEEPKPNPEVIKEPIEENKEQNEDLTNFTVAQLKELCKEKGIIGYSKLKKADLITKLEEKIKKENKN